MMDIPRLTICTLNCRGIALERTRRKVYHFLRTDCQADIICLQETNTPAQEADFWTQAWAGPAVWSRFVGFLLHPSHTLLSHTFSHGNRVVCAEVSVRGCTFAVTPRATVRLALSSFALSPLLLLTLCGSRLSLVTGTAARTRLATGPRRCSGPTVGSISLLPLPPSLTAPWPVPLKTSSFSNTPPKTMKLVWTMYFFLPNWPLIVFLLACSIVPAAITKLCALLSRRPPFSGHLSGVSTPACLPVRTCGPVLSVLSWTRLRRPGTHARFWPARLLGITPSSILAIATRNPDACNAGFGWSNRLLGPTIATSVPTQLSFKLSRLCAL